MESPVMLNLQCVSFLPAELVTVSKPLRPAATVQTVSHDLQKGEIQASGLQTGNGCQTEEEDDGRKEEGVRSPLWQPA